MTLLPPAPTREALGRQLVEAAIAGEVATAREHNLRNCRLMAERHEGYLFGLDPAGRWSYEDVVALMAERAGISPDLGHTRGQDTIAVDCTLDRLDAMAGRLGAAAAGRHSVLLATGHPAGLLPVYLALAAALDAAGCTVLTPAAGFSYDTRGRHREIRHIGGVAMVSDGGELKHTHSATPVRAMLTALEEDRAELPDLVVGDHGWAGGAGQAGCEAVGFADCNDPALFVGEAEGAVAVTVPLDDNVLPHLYAPMTAYLLAGMGSAPSAG